MNFRLFGCMLRLLHPPQSTADDQALLDAIERNMSAGDEVVEKARNIDRAMANIRDAGEGLFR
jgi:hypothetical protein